MGTSCAPLVADLLLFCHERNFTMSLSDDKQADVIEAFILFYFLVLWDHGFHRGTLKLLEGH